jgi:hypothetical protein
LCTFPRRAAYPNELLVLELEVLAELADDEPEKVIQVHLEDVGVMALSSTPPCRFIPAHLRHHHITFLPSPTILENAI